MKQHSMQAIALAAGSLMSTAAGASIVTDWNNYALGEVRLNKFGPPIVARALAVAHTCMYDAWAAYDPRALGVATGAGLRRPAPEYTDANKAKAISHAAYRCLVNLFPGSEARLDAAMRARGYDPADLSTHPATPQGIGNLAANAVIASRRDDGANQYGTLAPGAYADYTSYLLRNAPMPFCLPNLPGLCAPVVADPYHWQPLIAENGSLQKYIGPQWERVKPFALTSSSQFDAFVPVPNYLQGAANYLADVNQMVAISGALTPQLKTIVEYWADGPASELPPGHWGLFAQFVSKRDQYSIDQDVKMFFAMHNASFDAGIAAWHIKRKYEGVRPITAVRYLKQGQQILAWGGPGQPNQLIPGEKWTPYNPGSNLTPAFPGYISGHSSFSAASSTVLRLFTGSDNFGFSTVIPPNFGRVEPGIPAVPTTLSYPTFSAAAAEAGWSRLLGGIHFADDNTVGQDIGARVGRQAWSKSRFLFDGGLRVAGAASVTDGTEKIARQTSALSWSHTVEAMSNRLLLVSISYDKSNDPVTGVTYGGVPLKLLSAQSPSKGDNRLELWYLQAPKPGTADIVAAMPKDKSGVGAAVTFGGVDQAAPFGVLRPANDSSDSACVTLANAPAELVATILAASGPAKSISAGSAQSVQWNMGTGTKKSDVLFAGTTAAAAPMSTLCETLKDAQPWTMVAVPLNPAFAR